MSRVGPTVHAFFAERRASLVDELAAGLRARTSFYRDRPAAAFPACVERLVDAALDAVATGDPADAVQRGLECLAAGASEGLTFAEALDAVALFRRLVADLALEAIAAGVAGAAEGLRSFEALLDALVRRVADLYEGELVAAERTAHWAEEQQHSLYDGMPAMMHSIDKEGRLVAVNKRWLEGFGYTREEVLGRRSTELLTPESARYAREVILPAYFRTGRIDNAQYQFVRKDGSIMHVMLSAISERDAEGNFLRSWAVLIDVSEQVRLRELSTPLVPLGWGVLLMPLVGAMDSPRADQMMSVLLDGVAAHGARYAILDVTGVPVMDTTVADALIRATRATILLGAEPILTGLGPAAARTLVELGVDLGALMTCGTVRDGIAYALEQAGVRAGLAAGASAGRDDQRPVSAVRSRSGGR